jgi:hypothetical protein
MKRLLVLSFGMAVFAAAFVSSAQAANRAVAKNAHTKARAECEREAKAQHLHDFASRHKWIDHCMARLLVKRPSNLPGPSVAPLDAGRSLRSTPLVGTTPEVAPLRSQGVAPSGGLYPSGGAPGMRPLGSSGLH